MKSASRIAITVVATLILLVAFCSYAVQKARQAFGNTMRFFQSACAGKFPAGEKYEKCVNYVIMHVSEDCLASRKGDAQKVCIEASLQSLPQ